MFDQKKQDQDKGKGLSSETLAAAGVLLNRKGDEDSQGESDDILRRLLLNALEKEESRDKNFAEAQQRLRENAVQRARVAEEQRERRQAACNHRKNLGHHHETALGGQPLTGTGKVALICQVCGKKWLDPSQVPKGLLPPGHMIGQI